jgi:hypothetical protein
MYAAGFLTAFLMTWPFLPLSPANSLGRAVLEALLVLLGVITLGFAVAGMSRYLALRRAFYDRVRVAKASAVNEAVERLREDADGSSGLRLPNLVVLNRRQLDEYHVLSVRQQQVAFRNAQFAAIVGFVLLVAGIILSFRQDPGSDRYITAGLTALGSLLSGFISAVFYRSSDATAKQLRDFYKEPFRTGQVLMIERVAALDDGNPDDGMLRRLMVEHLLMELDPRRSDRPSTANESTPRHAGAGQGG